MYINKCRYRIITNVYFIVVVCDLWPTYRFAACSECINLTVANSHLQFCSGRYLSVFKVLITVKVVKDLFQNYLFQHITCCSKYFLHLNVNTLLL
jgi:hypothetical protein